jgi:hypothetical protein
MPARLPLAPAELNQASLVEAPRAAEEVPQDPSELVPGDVVAYGVVLPVGTSLRLQGDGSRMFYVDASMARVMRYLQTHLSIQNADIHPLGALLRSARPPNDAAEFVVDVGVRDEGDRTLVTVWNRTPVDTRPMSLEQGVRAAGIDPQTGRALPQFDN